MSINKVTEAEIEISKFVDYFQLTPSRCQVLLNF